MSISGEKTINMHVTSYFIHFCFVLKNDEVAFCKGFKIKFFLAHSSGRHAARKSSLRDVNLKNICRRNKYFLKVARETYASKVKTASRKQGNVSDASQKVNPHGQILRFSWRVCP